MGASTKASALGGDPYPAAELPLPAGETAHGTWSKVTQIHMISHHPGCVPNEQSVHEAHTGQCDWTD